MSKIGLIIKREYLRRVSKKSFILLTFLTLVCPAYAAPLQPGFKTLGIWEPAQNIRLDFAVWYPSRSTPFQVNYGDWSFSAARGRAPVEGKHPLILLSHDSAGSRFSLHELASQLARNGFVVMAFTHPGDNVDEMGTLFMPAQVAGRAKQLTQALDIALANPETGPLIDPDPIGVLGVGPGRKGRKRRSILHAVGTAAHGGFFHRAQPFRPLPRQACPRRSCRFPFLCHDVHPRQPIPHPYSCPAAPCREDAPLYPSARGTPPECYAPAPTAWHIARCRHRHPDVVLRREPESDTS